MKYPEIQAALSNVDIYVIDQILKNRYAPKDIILDAGCGQGRNLKCFYANKHEIYGIDADKERIKSAKIAYPKFVNNFEQGYLDTLPYPENKFNHIICNAVLHFAENEAHFFKMFYELVRVLKPSGSLLIRMASNIGLDGNMPYVREGNTNREGTLYLTREMITEIDKNYNLEFIEPIKTTNVQDKRAMTTLVLRKI